MSIPPDSDPRWKEWGFYAIRFFPISWTDIKTLEEWHPELSEFWIVNCMAWLQNRKYIQCWKTKWSLTKIGREAKAKYIAMADPSITHRVSISRPINWNGESKSAAEWSKEVGIGEDTIARRIFLGWSPERALTEPVNETYKRR